MRGLMFDSSRGRLKKETQKGMKAMQTTLCYIEKDGRTLMIHRIKKKNDMNRDKWLGVGGKFEPGESPEECMLREVREETGLTLTSWAYRGIVTFVSGDYCEYMHLFTADAFEGTLRDCDEGALEWVETDKLTALPGRGEGRLPPFAAGRPEGLP